MKTKILLLVSLVLLAVQGWALSVDSLTTYATGLIPNGGSFDVTQVTTNPSNNFNPMGTLNPTTQSDAQYSNDGRISFGVQTVGTTSTQKIRVQNASQTTRSEIFSAKLRNNTNNAFSVEDEIISVEPKTQWVPGVIGTLQDYVLITHEITITYKPTACGAHTAELKIVRNSPNPSLNYKLTGNAIERIINPSVTLLDFGNVVKGKSSSLSFTVDGTNLTGPMTVSSSFSYFTVSPTTLPASGGTVTVTFKPDATGWFSGTLTISGGEAVSKTVTVKGKGVVPNITTTTSSLAFGSVVKGNTVSKTFSVTGTDLTGNLTLSCNNSYYTVSPTTITAAQAAAGKTVTVTYKPTAAGTHNANVTISGGGASPKTVSVSGTCVDPKITISVSTLNFGTVVKDKAVSKTFTVTGTNLTGSMTVSSNNSNFTVSPTTLPASGGTVTVTYKPTAAGSHSGNITISGGAGATSTTVRLTVTGQCVIPNITPSVSTLNFGTVVKDKTASKTFTVTGTNLTGSLTVSSNSTYFKVSPTTITAAEAAAGKTVTVTYKPTATGSHSGTITIKGGDAADKVVSVSGKCVVPAISVSPTSIAFGTVAKGQQVDKSFWVTGSNLTGSLTVSSSNSNFIVSPTSISAAEAAEGKMVTVTYKPSAAGSHSGTITVKGGDAANKTVSVSGKCVVPEISVSTTSLVFGGYNDSRTFRVTGTNLTGSLTLTSNSSIFTVTPSTITASQAANGVTVTVKCNAATNIQHATGKITISGGGASPKYFNLTLDATSPQPYAPLVTPEDDGEDGNDEFSNVSLQEASSGPTTDVDELSMSSKVYAEGLNIIIETPIEQKALISDIAGHIREVNLQAGRNEVPVNANGIYIVRIREKSTKLMLK